jgi:hypothetical protein
MHCGGVDFLDRQPPRGGDFFSLSSGHDGFLLFGDAGHDPDDVIVRACLDVRNNEVSAFEVKPDFFLGLANGSGEYVFSRIDLTTDARSGPPEWGITGQGAAGDEEYLVAGSDPALD